MSTNPDPAASPSAASRTNEEWASLISATVQSVSSSTQTLDGSGFSAITSPTDPRFPATIDHTLLKADATDEDIDKLVDEAVKYGFKSCCVNGSNIRRVSERLRFKDASGTTVACAVVGFPLGANTSAVKALEAQTAISDGAQEIDMVLNIGALKSKNYAFVFQDISSVVKTASLNTPGLSGTKLVVKVILETCLLDREAIVAGTYIAKEAGADFVKTSTGFSTGGAKTENVELMKRTVIGSGEVGAGAGVRVKASGGVRTFEACLEMFKAGAERIGTSSGVAIMEKATSE